MKKLITYSVIFLLGTIFLQSCANNEALTHKRYNNRYYIKMTNSTGTDEVAEKTTDKSGTEKISGELTQATMAGETALQQEENFTKTPPAAEIEKGIAVPVDENHPERVDQSKTNTAIPNGPVNNELQTKQEKNKNVGDRISQIKKIVPQIEKQDTYREDEALSLLWIIIVVILILWVIGLIAGGFGIGGLINLLAVIALILLILWLLRIL